MQCVFSAQAERDLESIGDAIAIDNPARAISYILEMRARCQKLMQRPAAFMSIGELDGVTVRKALFGRYRIYYLWLPDDDAIIILHIRHTSRQEPEGFAPDII